MDWNKKQKRLIERFKKLTEQMSQSGIAICIDTQYDDIFLINERKFKRGFVSSAENVATEFEIEQDDKRIVEADWDVERLDVSVNFSYDGFYGIKKSSKI